MHSTRKHHDLVPLTYISKNQIFQNDLDVIENTLNALQTANKALENGQDIESNARNHLHGILVNCSKTVSKYLMELRKQTSKGFCNEK